MMEHDRLKNALHDLDDEELRRFLKNPSLRYPTIGVNGSELYDANGQQVLSESELQQMEGELESKFSEILEILRIDRNDPNSADTPYRLARMWVRELLAGRYAPAPAITVFPNRKNVDELVISKGIKIMSVCSHHWQPITGTCSIGYVPRDKVIGLSKFTRIVEWFARRGQIQEELGEQVADFLVEMLDPIALGVVIKAKHYCMIARGVEAHHSSEMVTSVMRGELVSNGSLRTEFLSLID
ncbi:MAG: GTP cyclohydrolase I [Bradyrhizobiaceae bacterium]|nr:GTP cyclohydrolase I [Bradyrhizobiaceae bacterium]